MKKLTLMPCSHLHQVIWPEVTIETNLKTPATAILTDFKKNRPLVVDAHTSAVEAEHLMKQTHVRLKLVIDGNDEFLGVVSLQDLHNQEIVKKVAKGFARRELEVEDFMRTKDSLNGLSYEQLQKSNIGQLVDALAEVNDQHVIVFDAQAQEVRGLISAADLARKLQLAISVADFVTFKLIYQTVRLAHLKEAI